MIGLGFSTRQKAGSEGSPKDRFFAHSGHSSNTTRLTPSHPTLFPTALTALGGQRQHGAGPEKPNSFGHRKPHAQPG